MPFSYFLEMALFHTRNIIIANRFNKFLPFPSVWWVLRDAFSSVLVVATTMLLASNSHS